MASAPPKEEVLVTSEQPPPYIADYGTGADNVPPTYAQSDPHDAPPSYESLYGNLKAARVESTGFMDFVKKAVVIVLGTIGCTVIVGLVLAVPISMIVMGSIYLDDCPAQRYIPIYLIVAGVFGVLKNCSTMIQRIKNQADGNDEENAKTNPFDGVIGCFLFVWFIAGNIWIYGTYNDFSDNKNDPDYCNETLYWYAFWITTATYIIAAFSCVCCICCGAIVACCGNNNK